MEDLALSPKPDVAYQALDLVRQIRAFVDRLRITERDSLTRMQREMQTNRNDEAQDRAFNEISGEIQHLYLDLNREWESAFKINAILL